MGRKRGPSRRELLAGAVGIAAAKVAGAQPRAPGRGIAPSSERAPSEKPARRIWENLQGISSTPLEELAGTLTPSALHFTRHHSGVPAIDPSTWRLLVCGQVARPMTFSLDDLKRFPARTQVCFVECAGNGAGASRGARPRSRPSDLDGATSNSEWTGVPLATLLREAGARPEAGWLLAESLDAGRYARSIPIAKAWDDALVAWAQNGEAVRAEQGFPARLLLPGWEGSASVKWLGRIALAEKPFMTREETARYSELLPDGKVRLFDFELGVKSILTFPAWPVVLTPGWWELRGLAWSGRGRIARVEVSSDGGASWSAAELAGPILPKAHTRFRRLWRWDGRPAVLMSRAVDEHGQVQPSAAELRRSRLPGSDYHQNGIRAWRVTGEGRVFHLPSTRT